MASVAPGGHVAQLLIDGLNANSRALTAALNQQATAIRSLAEADQKVAELQRGRVEIMEAMAVYAPDADVPEPVCPDSLEGSEHAGVDFSAPAPVSPIRGAKPNSEGGA